MYNVQIVKCAMSVHITIDDRAEQDRDSSSVKWTVCIVSIVENKKI